MGAIVEKCDRKLVWSYRLEKEQWHSNFRLYSKEFTPKYLNIRDRRSGLDKGNILLGTMMGNYASPPREGIDYHNYIYF
jgi:hypothetical protein